LKRKHSYLKKISDWQQRINDYAVIVDEKQIATVVAQWTKIPVEKLEESESQKLLRMEQELHKRIIGQDDAISVISRAIRRSRTGLRSARRPIGSFIFLGPTGVGKTELAKALAEFLFDDEDALIRFDMSEFMEKHAVSRLIGAPPGYVGYEEGGQLTEKVKRRPYSVILFDEIEKAHPDVYNILLQVLEEGELTDNFGSTTSFIDTVIIMTSNVGNREFQKIGKMGFNEIDPQLAQFQNVDEEVKRLFSPEFLNRIDAVVHFHKLNENHIKQILDLMLNEVNEHLEEQGIELIVSPKVKHYLVKRGFNEKYGARYLRRTVQNEIEDRLAVEILNGRFKDCHRVYAGIKYDAIYFKPEKNGNTGKITEPEVVHHS